MEESRDLGVYLPENRYGDMEREYRARQIQKQGTGREGVRRGVKEKK
jgi:hypothetical protein